ncbi:MAG: redox-sensitive transcriptional activator SoxR [Ilumatobacter sp.]
MLRSREKSDPLLSIGAVATRTGLAVSAIHFYERKGLISSDRASSGHRRFRKSVIRRLSFVLISQRLGYSLADIKAQLDQLPNGRTPTERDWNALAAGFTVDIEQRIAGLELLRRKLDECIGCGCLSLDKCGIWNPGDGAAQLGDGPRYLLGNATDDIPVAVTRTS